MDLVEVHCLNTISQQVTATDHTPAMVRNLNMDFDTNCPFHLEVLSSLEASSITTAIAACFTMAFLVMVSNPETELTLGVGQRGLFLKVYQQIHFLKSNPQHSTEDLDYKSYAKAH